jgi:hypothetical protein
MTDNFTRNSLLFAAVSLACPVTLSGCSIAMALHGHPEPNFDILQAGAPREEVEQEFGKPAAVQQLEGGKHEDTYKYEMGNSPNPGRAAVYGYAYLTIIGILGEPIYTLIEALQGHDEETKVVYGRDDRVLEVSGYRPPPPSQVVLSAEDAQRKFTRTPSPISQGNRTFSNAAQVPYVSIDPLLKELAHRLSTSMKDQGINRIAVLPVQDASGKENKPLGNYLTEKLSVKLHEEGSVKLVERAQLARVKEELALTQTGGFDESSAMRIGKLLGVDAVVTTFYADLGHSSIEINSKAVRVETGEVIGVGTAEIPRAAVQRMLE